ncbi:MAG: PD-(D/E)XK nuclease family protein [Pseudomonadales bacterium]|nr:PD-(D/E)XK nuclease family protein [Pseudomonadales bacterium]
MEKERNKSIKQPFSDLWRYCSSSDQNSDIPSRTVVLTPNRRLAVGINHEFDQHQMSKGAHCWESLQCWPLTGWYEEAWLRWQQAVLVSAQEVQGIDPVDWALLSPFQEQVLWEDIIRHSAEGENLLRVNGSAKLATGAYGLLRGWNIDVEGDWANTTDCAVFAGWLRIFRERCHSLGLICSVDLPDVLLDAPVWSRWFDRLVLVGFDEVTPQAQRLLDHLHHQFGTELIHLGQDKADRCSPVRVEFETPEDELLYCASWAKTQLQVYLQAELPIQADLPIQAEPPIQTELQGEREQQKSPTMPNIAVVVPDLQDRRREIERVFRECFDGLPFNDESNELLAQLGNVEDSDLGIESTPNLFNISGGEIFSSYAIISSAFSFLDLLKQDVEMSTVSACLGSPFMAGGEIEYSARAQFDVMLRQLRREALFLGMVFNQSRSFVKVNEATGESHLVVPRFTGIVKTVLEKWLGGGDINVNNINRQKKTPSQWSIVIEEVLQVFGWPGDRTLSSQEFQLVSKWHELLAELASIDEVVGVVGFSTAISLLRRLCNDTRFQKETKNQPPIQVLGVLEAAAQNFDALWFAGLDSETWPPSGYAHPFLPVEMQRRLNMPHSSAQREFDFAKIMTDRYRSAAEKVVFSSARWQGDNELTVSSLIQPFPLDEYENVEDKIKGQIRGCTENFKRRQWSHLRAAGIDRHRIVEVFERDVRGPILEKNQSVVGGTWVLKAQADCPFKAYASIRLNAHSMDNPIFGITAAERGSSIHRVMEIFWTRCQSWEKLNQLAAAEKTDWVTEAAARTVAEQAGKTPEHMRGSVYEIEVRRLVETAESWLALELQRTPFKVVAIEEKKQIKISSINLSTRADRIDRVGEDGYVVIDYKTAEVSTQTWRDERLDEPQLPLYCVSVDAGGDQLSNQSSNPEIIQGVMFAQIKNGKMAIKGQHSEALTLTEKKSRDIVADGEWDLTLSQWRDRLDSLATEFAQGYAEVLPKSLVKSCRYCDLQPLCRVSEIEYAADFSEVES